MRADALTLPPARDLPGDELARRKRHLVSEARRQPTHARRLRPLAIAVVLALAAALSLPAFGVVGSVKSWLAGGHDPDSPRPTAPDVVIASGTAGVPWKIVATPSDQGLCLFLVSHPNGDEMGGGSCGYWDIRGDLPRAVRGDPAQSCIATPTKLAPCGSLPRHWVDLGGGGSTVGFTKTFAFGPLARDVASVDLVLSNGETVHANVVVRPKRLRALNFYWATWPCRPLQPASGGLQECAENAGPELRIAIARDSAGRVLERRVPAWNGNPTGDPNGSRPPVPTR
jgi:hypothetical protein